MTVVALAAFVSLLAGDAVEEHALGEAFVIVGAAPVLRGALEAEVVVEAPVAVGVGKEERARRPGFAEAFDRAGDQGAADAEAAVAEMLARSAGAFATGGDGSTWAIKARAFVKANPEAFPDFRDPLGEVPQNNESAIVNML